MSDHTSWNDFRLGKFKIEVAVANAVGLAEEGRVGFRCFRTAHQRHWVAVEVVAARQNSGALNSP